MSPRDPRLVRVRGVGCGEGGTVILSIDVDGLYGAAGPPLQVVMLADEARLTAQLMREAAGRRVAGPVRPADPDDDAEAAVLEAGFVALEGWAGAIGRHVRRFLGFLSSDGAADPRAPP